MPRRSHVAIAAALAIATTALTCAPPAPAGSYSVRQCDYASGNGHHDFRWQAAGAPAPVAYPGSGCGEFGLAARNSNVGSEQTYPSGAYGGWFAYAPPGTVFTAFSGAFGTLSGCCINGLATYAEATEHANGAGARSYLFQGELGDDTWYAPSGVRGPVGRSWSASASGFVARRVGFHLRCGPGFSCFQRATGDLRLRARSFDFTLRDDVAPSLAPPAGTLLGGGWIGGERTLAFAASDAGGGLTGVTAAFDSGAVLSSPSACTTVGGRYARLQPCPLRRSGAWTVDTARLPDGARTLAVRARDAGGATVARAATVMVDNTAPAAPIEPAVVGGSAWRRANGFAVRWTNPGRQHAPLVRAHYRACPAGAASGGCVGGEREAQGVDAVGPIALPRSGEWDVRVWLEDGAGNADEASASAPRRLRFDPEPPALRFLPRDAAAPRRVTVEASDRLSGIASVAVELRRRGAVDWMRLPSTRDGRRVTAEIDDRSLPPGEYELRAWALDRAGNRTAIHGIDRHLPLRAQTRLRAAAIMRAVSVRHGCRGRRIQRCGRRRPCGRMRRRLCGDGCAPRCPAARRLRSGVTARRAVEVRHGTPVPVRGRLTTAGGKPLGGRRIAVELVSADREVRLPDVRTDARGGIALVLPARRSAAVRLRFAGDATGLPSADELTIRVPAPVTIRAPRRAAAGRAVRFRGRVRGGAIPQRGKLVEVQAHFRGRWRTISAVRTRRDGRWRFAYRFGSAGQTARYRFRARVPVEAGYPFAAGNSRPTAIVVRPR